MRERAGQSQLPGQGPALMKHWDQGVAASASFTGHWAWMSKDSRAPFREKQRGGGMLKPRQPSLSCTNIPSFAPGLVYGRMGQFMAEMRCQIFYNLAEHQTQSAKPRTSHRLPPMLSLPFTSLWFLLLWAWRLGHYFGNWQWKQSAWLCSNSWVYASNHKFWLLDLKWHLIWNCPLRRCQA